MIPAVVLLHIEINVEILREMDGLAQFLGTVTRIGRVEDYIYMVSRTGDDYSAKIGHLDSPLGRHLQERENVLLNSKLCGSSANGPRSAANKRPQRGLRATSPVVPSRAATNGYAGNLRDKGTEQPV